MEYFLVFLLLKSINGLSVGLFFDRTNKCNTNYITPWNTGSIGSKMLIEFYILNYDSSRSAKYFIFCTACNKGNLSLGQWLYDTLEDLHSLGFD
jgi:hypothetical protein